MNCKGLTEGKTFEIDSRKPSSCLREQRLFDKHPSKENRPDVVEGEHESSHTNNFHKTIACSSLSTANRKRRNVSNRKTHISLRFVCLRKACREAHDVVAGGASNTGSETNNRKQKWLLWWLFYYKLVRRDELLLIEQDINGCSLFWDWKFQDFFFALVIVINTDST